MCFGRHRLQTDTARPRSISTEEAAAHETKPHFTFEQFPPTPAGREQMVSYMQVLRQLYDKTGGSELVDASGLVHAVISSGCLQPL